MKTIKRKDKENFIYLNGRMVPESEALISVYDRGFLYGDGVFETLRAYDGKIFKTGEHISRLVRSAKAIALAIPHSPGEISKILTQTLKANRLKNARLRITLSRGRGDVGLVPDPSSSPTMVVVATEFEGYPPSLYEEGVEIAVVKTRKVPAACLDPGAKSLNYLNHILARMEAKSLKAFEGILLNDKGYLCEGTVSNLFLVKEGCLLTPAPSCGILEGITRATVMDIAQKLGITVQEGEYHPDEFLVADECFLTNTTGEVMPVVRALGLPGRKPHLIGKGRVGPITRQLRKAYQQL